MQQVFGVINSVLARDEEAAKRTLEMRTYKVMPLSQRSGIIEWCENTQPIGLYLVGEKGRCSGAHQRFRSQDILPALARQTLQVSIELSHVDLTILCSLTGCDQKRFYANCERLYIIYWWYL